MLYSAPGNADGFKHAATHGVSAERAERLAEEILRPKSWWFGHVSVDLLVKLLNYVKLLEQFPKKFNI